MKHICNIAVLISSALIVPLAHGQANDSGRSPFDELLEATRFIQNYKETAEVTARVFAARSKGSDKEYAAFMAKVAKADLSDLQACLSKAYASGPLTADDAKELVKVFKSPIGTRLLELSQKMNIATIELGTPQRLDPSLLGDAERQELARVYQNPAFARYGAFMASPTSATSNRACVASSKVGKESGIKF